ncbi:MULTISPECIES: YihY/virulence factor BrkB family protein [Streptomyces]|uniref:YihY/virulence factor BrkB family protein n=1 Tax=Streptomyces gilvifuscus TaxID=1550617 RepID=A0ABT5G3W2_9ACTN|nr:MULTISPECIES: YihY/virulence factor BrkB family protein [Streptomyces]MBK3639891.1 YihY/virulence factor BrkB family protein [Streptomyces sp. MBT33]MDC2959541.1 YihY/virulence factor BrkB family protein [Streptomyces gilvifuscus]
MSADPFPGETRPAVRPVSRPRPHAAWWPALRRTPVSLWNDDISDFAAALTYYAILAVLPALLVAVLAFGLISPGTAREFVTQVTAYAPAESAAALHAALSRMLGVDGGAWPLLVVGTVSALWSASSYLAVFRRALHRMHRIEDSRSPLRRAHRIVLTAFGLLVLLLTGSLALLLTGPLAEDLGRVFGLGATAAWGWSVLRWPLLLCLVALLVIVVFHTGPVAARRRAHSLPGGVLAALLWLAVSTGFALYASTLSTYSRLYGSLAGAVVFLIWLWLSNLALLGGAQFTAELSKEAAGLLGTGIGPDGRPSA